MELAKIQALKQERMNLVTEARTILDKADNEKRAMTGEETTKYENLDKKIDELTADIQRREKALERERELAERETPEERQEEGQETEKRDIDREEYRAAYLNYIRYGVGGLSQEERDLINSQKANLSGNELRALSAVTGAAGGYIVPTGFYNKLIEAQKTFGGMRTSGATIIPTAGGNPLPIPTGNDTNNEGELVEENKPVGSQDTVFGQKTLGAYKFSSKTILIPIELLMDSAFDIEAYITKIIATRIARAENKYYTIGTGVAQPEGIMTAALLGKTGAAGQINSILYEDFIDLEFTIDAAYRKNAKYMMHDQTIKTIKKMKDSEGRPLWQPGIAVREPDTINGYSYFSNNDMDQVGASKKSIAFGDFSNLFIRDAMDVTLFRINEKYIENGQVGFLAFARHDSKFIDPGSKSVAYFAHPAA